MPRALYDEDFFLWSQEQAALLRDKKCTDLDLDNLAEEIESLGKRDRRELESRLRVLMTHLLKWRHQSEERSGSWGSTITEQRLRIQPSSAIARACSPKHKPMLTVNILTPARRHLMKPGF